MSVSPGKPRQPGKYHQGRYEPTNPDKYIGDVNEIWYRSSLEKKMCYWCDHCESVLKWNSEGVRIGYIGKDNRPHTYFPDFLVRIKNENRADGYETVLFEVKPESDIINQAPKIPDRVTESKYKSYLYQLDQYEKNIRKWRAAADYCEKMGYTFKIISEKNVAALVRSVVAK